MSGVEVTVTRSAGTDGAVVVFVDTDFEPDASDGGPGLRIVVNDTDTYPLSYLGKKFEWEGPDDHPAKAVKLTVQLDEIAYVTDETKEG